MSGMWKCLPGMWKHYYPAPRWQSTERHRRLKTIMQDRPDLIQSELAGLVFDSLQQAFASADIERMFSQECPEQCFGQPIYTVVDPAAGGPQSEYAILSLTRSKGLVTVTLPLFLLCVFGMVTQALR
jgi:hypothetical protein